MGNKRNLRVSKKGQMSALNNLLPTIVIFAVVILATSFITGVISDVRGEQTANSSAYNITGLGLTGMTNLSGQFGNIGTIIAIVTIIGLLVGAFVVFQQRE